MIAEASVPCSCTDKAVLIKINQNLVTYTDSGTALPMRWIFILGIQAEGEGVGAIRVPAG